MKKLPKFIQTIAFLVLLGMSQPQSVLATEAATETGTTTSSSDSLQAGHTSATSPRSEESTVGTTTSLNEQQIQQVFHIQQVFSTEKIDNQGLPVKETRGINGAHYNVYNLTALLKKEIGSQKVPFTKEKQKTLMVTLGERAERLAKDQLKVVSEGETKTVNGKEGVFSFSVKVPESTPQAFYVVNTATPKTATKSQPLVIITPVCDRSGVPMKDVWFYPKSEPVTPVKEVKKIVSTGVQRSWLERLVQQVSHLGQWVVKKE